MSKVEYIDDPALSARMAEKQQDLRDKPIQELTVAERLTLRAMDRLETLMVDSKDGEIELIVRLPLASEVRELELIQAHAVRIATEAQRKTSRLIKMQKSDPDKLAKLQQELDLLQAEAADGSYRLKEIVADLCVDESISIDFLESGQLAQEDIGSILQGILKINQERAAEARFFRSK